MGRDITLDEWAAQAWNGLKLRPLTRLDYQKKYRVHIQPVFGHRLLAEITPWEVQSWVNGMQPVQQKAYLPILQSLMKAAWRNARRLGLEGLDNPARDIEKMRYKADVPPWMTLPTVLALDFKAHTALFRFMAKHGTRWSETQGIKRYDIYRKADGMWVVAVRASREDLKVVREGGKPVFGPKNGEWREVPYLGGWSDDFPVNYAAARKRFAAVTTAATGKRHKIHSLRYTFAHTCNSQGVPLKVAQQWMGHATAELTANLYTQVIDQQSNDGAEIMRRYLATLGDDTAESMPQ